MNRKSLVNANSLMYVAIVLQTLYAFLPIIRVAPMIVRYFFRIAPVILVFLSIILCNNRRMQGIYILVNLFAVFIAIIRSLVYANAIDESYFSNIQSSILYWTYLIEGYYILQFFDRKQMRKLLKMSIPLVTVSIATTIVVAIVFPGSIRSTSSFASVEFSYYKYNAGAYSFVYAIPFFCVILFCLIQNKEVYGKGLLIACLIGSFLLLVFSQYMTAIVIAMVSLFCVIRSRRGIRIIATIILLFVVVFLFSSQIGAAFAYFAMRAKNAGLDSLSSRFAGMGALLSSGTTFGDVGARQYLYSISIKHFFRNPIFGVIGTNGFSRSTKYTVYSLLNSGDKFINAVGQHSDIIDLLGGGGLMGFVPFVIVILSFWKAQRKKLSVTGSSLKYSIIILIQYIVYGLFDHSFSCADVALVVFVFSSAIISLQNDDCRFINAKKQEEDSYYYFTGMI